MKKIKLSKGKFALIDDEDFERASKIIWHLQKTRWFEYAANSITVSPNKQSKLYLHRFILNAPKGMVVDHIDGNGLNNQKSNLRLCTNGQNQSCGKKRSAASGFRGVGRSQNRHKKWQVYITHENEKHFIGCFENKIEAAKAWDKAAIKYHGEFATLNFKD